jgi:hypothetical protein
MVIDEAHQVLTCLEYRGLFQKIKTFASFNVQKIYLTASLPPRLVPRFLQETSLPNSTVIIRAPTYQINLRYHVITIEPTSTKIDRFVVDLAHVLTTTFLSPKSRGIIFCTSKAMVEHVGTSFNNSISHSDLSPLQRQFNEQSWFDGDQQWIVATTTLIHGVDCQDVGGVVCLEMPFGGINTYQAFGRGGRNKKPAMVFLVNSQNLHFIKPIDPDDDLNCLAEGIAWMRNDKQCRRFGFSAFLDDKGVSCPELAEAVACDFCKPDTPLSRAIRVIIPDPPRGQQYWFESKHSQTQLQEIDDYDMGDWDDDTLMQVDMDILQGVGSEHSTIESSHDTHNDSSSNIPHQSTVGLAPVNSTPSMSVQIDVQFYHQQCATKKEKARHIDYMMSHLCGHCIVCWAWKGKLVNMTSNHRTFTSCKDKQDGFLPHALGWIAFKKTYKLTRLQYCWTCGLPQGEFTPLLHPQFQKGIQMHCPIQDVVVLILWCIRHDPATWLSAIQRFPRLTECLSMQEFATWIAVESGADGFYNGLELVCWFWLRRQNCT